MQLTPFGPIYLEDNYVLFEVGASNWDGTVSFGPYSYQCYWEGVPRRSRRFVRIPPDIAQHFTPVGGFTRLT
jgi:hypothetical protein